MLEISEAQQTHLRDGVLAPRAKLRPRIVPRLAASAPHATPPASASSPPPPPPQRDTGPVIPRHPPVGAHALALAVSGAEVPAPNVLAVQHLARIAGGLLYAATSRVPWALLLRRCFEVDVHLVEPERYFTETIHVLHYWPRDRYLELAPKYWRATRARLDPKELARELGPITVPPPARKSSPRRTERPSFTGEKARGEDDRDHGEAHARDYRIDRRPSVNACAAPRDPARAGAPQRATLGAIAAERPPPHDVRPLSSRPLNNAVDAPVKHPFGQRPRQVTARCSGRRRPCLASRRRRRPHLCG